MQVIWDLIHGTGIILFVIGTAILSSFSPPSSEMVHQKEVLDSLPRYSNSSMYKIGTGGGIDTPRSYSASFQSPDSSEKVLEFYKQAMIKKGWHEKSSTREAVSSGGSVYADLRMINGIDEVSISYRGNREYGIQVSNLPYLDPRP